MLRVKDKDEGHSARMVYCLCIDLIGSTESGLELSTEKLDIFNRALIQQIEPHLEKLRLTDVLLKFTGDGWLLMTSDEDQVTPICCLATILARRFQEEMSQKTGLESERIPPLRMSVCAGRDIRVRLPDGSSDWLGDSARRATRASGYCYANEILVDVPVQYHVFRDFYMKPADVENRPLENQPKKAEEALTLCALGELKPESAIGSESPDCFVYTLSTIGKPEQATSIAEQVSGHLEDQAGKLYINEVQDRERVLRNWNRLMVSAHNYEVAFNILQDIQKASQSPDVVTYTTLISLASDYETGKSWLETMLSEGIQPDVVTYSTLISLAPDYDTGKSWLETMLSEGIQPDVVTYSTLISLAPDYDTGKSWLETMLSEGIQPDVVTYSTLISRAPDYEIGKSWLKTMLSEGIQPDVVTYNTLISLAPDYETGKLWLETMLSEGIQPDVVTYTTLISLAPDYETGKSWLETMLSEGIQPDVVTYNTLISQAPDYETAKSWLETMLSEGIQPDVVTYNTLFSKNIEDKPAREILTWYLAQECHPEEPIQTAIANYRKKGQVDQALLLVLHYPHLQAARKVIRAHATEALSYFQAVCQENPNHPDAVYALGLTFLQLGREDEARPHLQKALSLAEGGPRKAAIEKLLN